jgi:tripartite-type tricarboxylate transporter receptor subunit TctC
MRKVTRLFFAVLASAPAVSSTPVAAQTWPAKPIRLVVSFPPGGGLDAFARLVAQKLQEKDSFGQQIVVDNRSGASGMIGAEAVAKAPPDGYTVLFSTAAEITINQHLYKRMAYDPVKDLAPVSYASHAALLLSTHPSLPVKSLKELIALARNQPGALTYASAGTGSLHHLSGELLKTHAKINIVHVPYKGAGPAVIDMMGGQVSMGFSALPSSLPHARTGKLRAISVTGPQRSEVAPDLPTFVEQGFPAIDVVSWYGVFFPSRTPPDIVNRMSDEVARVIRLPEVRRRLLDQGIEVAGTTPAQFASFIQSEIKRYGGIVRASGAVLD